jgi:carbonic anhydrase/acetyltransferase-like protein (isoleucine patch superfamily)
MDRSRSQRGLAGRFRPWCEPFEARVLLSQAGALGPFGFLNNPPGFHLVRPNTPVAPFGAALATATFVDPTVRIHNGNHVVAGQKTFIGPYVALDATVGFIKVGSGSQVLDNAVITSTPAGQLPSASNVLIGDKTSIGYGATVNGPSTIGAYGDAAQPTGVGPNAVINGAVISPGAIVGPLAYVGPGVVVPAGLYVKPGASVTTEAEATDPALGKVEPIPSSVSKDLSTDLSRGSALANGYTYLYQGQAATGLNPGIDPSITNVFNGNLAAVLGTSQQPGPTTTTAATGISFEPSRSGPKFPGPHLPAVEADIPTFPARITGDAQFTARAHRVAHSLGKLNAIRADQGQPIKFFGALQTGRAVTVNSPLGGTVTTTTITGTPTTTTTGGTTTLTINNATTTTTTKTVGGVAVGAGFQAGDHAVILGGPGNSYSFYDNVTVGPDAVVQRSNLGVGVTVGAKSYVADSTVAPGTNIPPGTILIDNKVVGQVQW